MERVGLPVPLAGCWDAFEVVDDASAEVGWVPGPVVPALVDREALNAAQLVTGAETGFWDEDGRPAPWPGDIDEWAPATGEPVTYEPGQPF